LSFDDTKQIATQKSQPSLLGNNYHRKGTEWQQQNNNNMYPGSLNEGENKMMIEERDEDIDFDLHIQPSTPDKNSP
jgi:hypothetical protein